MAGLARESWLFLMCCCLVVGLMSCLSTAGASRLTPTLMHKNLQSNSKKVQPQMLRAELMHRDHPDSPLSPSRGASSSAHRLAAAVRRDKARLARRLGSADFQTPITANDAAFGDGEYTMDVYLGTPARKFTMIVDTGSDLVWVQCLPCSAPGTNCFYSPNPYFDPSASSTYSAIPCTDTVRCDPLAFNGGASCDSGNACHLTYGYLDGSGIQGTLSTETISLSNATEMISGPHVPDFLFGCMNNDTSGYGYVDGLAGFGRGPISLPRQFSESSSLNVFSYCLVPSTAATTLTSSLVFGVANPNASKLAYTPMLSPNVNDITSYYVNMTGISVNGTDVGVPSTAFQYNSTSGDSGVIFDSGTNLFFLKRNTFTKVLKSLKGLITYPTISIPSISALCYNVSGVQQPTYPSMSLHFSGMDGTVVDFPLSPDNIFVPFVDTIDCLAINPVDGVAQNIIGNTAQADHYIEYDVENARIGWASRDCSVPS